MKIVSDLWEDLGIVLSHYDELRFRDNRFGDVRKEGW